MQRFQFTLRDMFLATTLIAIGMSGFAVLFKDIQGLELVMRSREAGLAFVLSMASGMAIGIGVFVPFHRPRRGAIVGAILGLLVLVRWSLTNLVI